MRQPKCRPLILTLTLNLTHQPAHLLETLIPQAIHRENLTLTVPIPIPITISPQAIQRGKATRAELAAKAGPPKGAAPEGDKGKAKRRGSIKK